MIGPHLDLANNQSHSFRLFVKTAHQALTEGTSQSAP